MTERGMVKVAIQSPKIRLSLGIMCVISLLCVLVAAASMPFIFETGSILYKLGADKTFLRTGKVIGTLAAVLILLQLPLTARLAAMDHIFSLNRMYLYHRVNAVLVACLALLHPLLVFAPEDISSFPVELKYWPEVLGALLLVLIGIITATGLWRLFLNFSFHRWWLFHRIVTLSAVVLLVVHVLYGSENYEDGMPRFILILSAGVYGLLLFRVKIKALVLKYKSYVVTRVIKEGEDIYSVELSPRRGAVFNYVPGQFAFLSFKSEGISSEEHPFTISSSPSRPHNLLFSIRCSGDWTGLINRITPGDKAFIDGPYGRFSYLFSNGHSEYIMIAGGIGITPMVSMLRYMADCDQSKRVTLIWSNRTSRDIVFADEFSDLERRIKGLRTIHVLTRQTGVPAGAERLNRDRLAALLTGCNRKVPVFICGPYRMMKEVRSGLVAIGFVPGLIYTEEFRL